jgi:catechol 2,3-dioxygenase-like lactoylglutathione lyase family enzyme
VIGRFHEVSVLAPDLLASLAFYERLGFVQVTAGEAFSHPYAVVADGRLAIGLHGGGLASSPAIAFVLPDLRVRLAALEDAGVAILERRLGDDVFNEASLEAAGQPLRLLEARTHSPSALGPAEASRLGWFEEIALPVRDLAGAQPEWERLGFVPAEEGNDPYPHVGLTSDTLNVALVTGSALRVPTLVFQDTDLGARVASIADRGFAFEPLPRALDPSRHALLRAPEGTPLLLTDAP